MAFSTVSPNSAAISSFTSKPISKNLIITPFFVSFPSHKTRLCAIKTNSDGSGAVRNSHETAADLLRKPTLSSKAASKEYSDDWDSSEDWEDMILAATVPLVGFVRMILQSGKYESGDRLTPEHERTILERLLPYHPDCAMKIGPGVDYITIGYHPNFESSRCLFIVRKDGELVDFSYWKCLRGLIRKNYPVYADTFILRHFRNRRHND